jgi:hypothetical protein
MHILMGVSIAYYFSIKVFTKIVSTFILFHLKD